MEKLPKSEEQKYVKPNNKKLTISFILGLISCSSLLYMTLVDTTASYLKRATRAENGSAMHEFLKKELYLHLSVYLFNVTNAQEFIEGKQERLAVQEVGPFSYTEIRKNEDIEFDEESETIRYSPKMSLVLDPDRSIGRPEDVNITMPNIPMLGLTSNVYDYGFIVRSTFNILSGQINSKPIVSMDAQRYMWGYHEPLVTIANRVIPGYVPMEKMGLLDELYSINKPNHLEVSSRDDDKFMIKTRNGQTKLEMSESMKLEDCKYCSTFENTYEGMTYPSGVKPGFPLRLYRNGLCKVLDMKYQGLKTMDYGGDALVYTVDEKFYRLDESENSTGLLLLPECFIGMPLAISKAHFLDIDPKVYERIDGMHPDEKYREWVTIDPKIGMELETKISLQISLVLGDLSYSTAAKRFSNMVIPICYMTLEQPALAEENADVLIRLYVIWPRVRLTILSIMFLTTLMSWTYFTIMFRHWLQMRSEETANRINFPATIDTKLPIAIQEAPLNNGSLKSKLDNTLKYSPENTAINIEQPLKGNGLSIPVEAKTLDPLSLNGIHKTAKGKPNDLSHINCASLDQS